MNTKLSIRFTALFLTSTIGLATAVSCSSGGTGGSGTGGTGGTVIVGPSSSGSTTTTTTTTGTTTTGTTTTGTGTGGSTPSCTDADAGNCYSCTPTTNPEFLNACNGQTCQPYDNSSTNLPLLTADGGLPPLP